MKLHPRIEEVSGRIRARSGASLDRDVLRGADAPFSAGGGLRPLTGELDRAIVKVSAVKPEHRAVEAPAIMAAA